MPTRFYSEADCFCRYLIGHGATGAVAKRYAEALERLDLTDTTTPFDQQLLTLASRHPLACEALDAVSTFFARRSTLRRRLFVLSGLLETDPDYADEFLSSPTPLGVTFLRLSWETLRTAVLFLFGLPTVLFLKVTS